MTNASTTTNAAATKTKVGDFLVWLSVEHNALRMGISTTDDMEFEVEAFTRAERATCHSIFMGASA